MSDTMPEEDKTKNTHYEKLQDGSKSDSRRSSQEDLSDSEALSMAKACEFKSKAEELSQKFTDKFESQFQEMIENLANDMQVTNKKENRKQHLNQYDEDGLKIFVARESLLTELLEINHIQTIYNVFVALLFVFTLNTMLYDYLETGRILDLSTLSWAFGKTNAVVWNWVKLQALTLILYPLFLSYANNQISSFPLPNLVWCFGYLGYLGVFLYLPVRAVINDDLPPASTIILITEQVRFIMKVHAFVRSNYTKIIKHTDECKHLKKDDVPPDALVLPGFSQYLYFLFIPTLIYRDNYPMTPYVRWNFVVSNLLQVIGCIFYTYYMLARFCVPVFQNTGKETGNIRTLLLSAFSCMLPGILVLLVGFFAILHSWMNAFAEMTRFADRMFYRDWWNSNSFSSYYRMWNVVVHDWLYAYVYKDLYRLFGPKSRGAAAMSVFFLSAIFHEYILALAFRFFYPALLVMFGGVGLVFFFVKPSKGSKNPVWNIYLWVSLTMGSGILMMLYSVEWYASQNCTKPYDSYLEYFIPYSFDSNCVVWEWKKK